MGKIEEAVKIIENSLSVLESINFIKFDEYTSGEIEGIKFCLEILKIYRKM
jgi:hypothetical protein